MKLSLKIAFICSCLPFPALGVEITTELPEAQLSEQPVEIPLDGTKQIFTDSFDEAVLIQPAASKGSIFPSSIFRSNHFLWNFECFTPFASKLNPCTSGLDFLSGSHFVRKIPDSMDSPARTNTGTLSKALPFTIPGRSLDRDYMIVLSQKFDVSYSKNSWISPEVNLVFFCGVQTRIEDLGVARHVNRGDDSLFKNENLTISSTIKSGQCPENQFYVNVNAVAPKEIDFKEFEMTVLELGVPL